MKRAQVGTVAVCCAALCILPGCTAGPDYLPPSISAFVHPDKQGFAAGQGEKSITIAPVPDDWWRLYDDQRLDALVRQAMAANTNLRAAAANLERSHALLEEAKTLREPSVVLNGGVEYAQFSGEQFLL